MNKKILSEKGQSMVEYGIMISTVGATAIGAGVFYNTYLDAIISAILNSISMI